jgi:hypothetical protein
MAVAVDPTKKADYTPIDGIRYIHEILSAIKPQELNSNVVKGD